MNKIGMKTYVYPLLLAILMQGCESGEVAPSTPDATKVDDQAVIIIGSSQLLDGAVTTSKLDDKAVIAGKIADNAVGSDEIQDGAVGSDEIAAGAVGSDEIAAGAVGSDEIAAGAVTEGKLNYDLLNKITGLENQIQKRAVFFNDIYGNATLTSPFTVTLTPQQGNQYGAAYLKGVTIPGTASEVNHTFTIYFGTGEADGIGFFCYNDSYEQSSSVDNAVNGFSIFFDKYNGNATSGQSAIKSYSDADGDGNVDTALSATISGKFTGNYTYKVTVSSGTYTLSDNSGNAINNITGNFQYSDANTNNCGFYARTGAVDNEHKLISYTTEYVK